MVTTAETLLMIAAESRESEERERRWWWNKRLVIGSADPSGLRNWTGSWTEWTCRCPSDRRASPSAHPPAGADTEDADVRAQGGKKGREKVEAVDVRRAEDEAGSRRKIMDTIGMEGADYYVHELGGLTEGPAAWAARLRSSRTACVFAYASIGVSPATYLYVSGAADGCEAWPAKTASAPTPMW